MIIPTLLTTVLIFSNKYATKVPHQYMLARISNASSHMSSTLAHWSHNRRCHSIVNVKEESVRDMAANFDSQEITVS